MKPLFSRADLLRVAVSVGAEGLAAIAEAHGFERVEPEPEPEPPQPPAKPGASGTKGEDAAPLLPPPYWQPRSIVFDAEDASERRESAASAAGEAAEAAGHARGSEASSPASPPLSPWRRLGPLLQEALMGEHYGRRVDLPKLVRRIAEGRQLGRLPRRRRRVWAPLEVLVDRPLRLAPFWSDQSAVVRELDRVLGRDAVVVRVLTNGTASAPDDAGWRRRSGRAGVPVLALTDLGWYAGEAEQSAWLRWARRARAANQRLVALAPVPRSRWTTALARAWRAIPWERPAPGAGRDGDGTREERVDRLLVRVAPAMRIERGLLRTIRRVLPRAEADVGIEADLWVHPVLGDIFPGYRVIDAGEVDGLRRRFAAEVDPEEQARVLSALRAWHWTRELLPEVWHLEALALERILGSGAARQAGITAADVERADGFMSGLFHELEEAGDDADAAEVLRRWCLVVREQVPRTLWDPATRAGAALQRIAFRVGGVDVPDADPRLREGRDQEPAPAPRDVQLFQVGGALVSALPDPPGVGSLVATIVAARPRLALASAVVDEGWLDLAGAGEHLSAPPRGAIELRTDRSTLRLEPITKPSWARAIGRDGYGLWAELFVKGVAYRMRWIPPGRFVMGSPEGEPGRYKDEGPQHEVTITRGFWLGETPVTQALWEAVMGENPSHFKTPDRPVEQVSWEDCQGEGGLMERLHRALDPEEGVGGEDLGRFRLPTEAEWEYACRAGTRTATYAGAIELLGERNAPVLDAIAWYGGNSGVEYDLDDGYDSSEWSEKQHEHSKAGTRRVAQKLANAWGLHDMLGNVWEWCMDYADLASGYASEPQQDPSGPATGERRVYRGGAWSTAARDVRAACRLARAPGDRDGDLGLRLARDQGGPVGPEGPGGPDPEGRESPEGQERG